jgi:hypothetical protein
MKGSELPAWRKRNRYLRQEDLMWELGIKSRGTISAWENSDDDLPRTIELAILALEHLPLVRKIDGKRW